MEPELYYNKEHGTLDIQFENGDIKTGNSLRYFILTSLLTDGRALPSDPIPDGSTNRRGCWFDTFDQVGFKGSRLWTLSKRIISREGDITRIKDIAAESLNWMITEQIVDKFSITVSRSLGGKVTLSITAHKGRDTTNVRYEWLWSDFS